MLKILQELWQKKSKPNSKASKGSKKPSTTPKSSTPSASRGKIKLPGMFYNVRQNCILIMVMSFLFYGNTLLHDYTQDDAIVIYDNMFTTQGVAGIPGILQYDTFYGFFKEEGKAALVAGGRYRPLTLVLFALEWTIFGDSPFVFHLTTVLLYGFTGIMLYLMLLQMLRPMKGEGYALFISLVTTFLFIAHPIHTEVVANIKGSDEIVTLLGSLAALYFSLRAWNEKQPKFNIWAGVIFFLALLAKENAITFMAIVPLAYFIFTKADMGKIISQTIPFAVATVAFLMIRFAVLGADFGGACTELMNCPYLKVQGASYVPFTGGEKMATIFYTLGKYIQLLFVPHPLTHDYYPYHVGIMSFSNWQSLLSLVMYFGLGIYAVMRALKKDPLAFGILFYLLTLSIVSNIVFPVGTNMAERFAFMPSLGFCFVMAVLAFRLVKMMSNNKKNLAAKNFTPVLAIAGVVLVLFFAKTFTRNQVWKDNYTLFTTDVEISQNSAKLQNSAGGSKMERAAQMEETNPERNTLLTESVAHLQQALRIHPNYKNAYLLLGNAQQFLNQYDESIQSYLAALRLDPGYNEAETNMTIAYRNGGRYFGEKQGNFQKAAQFLETAYQRNPQDFETLRLLGIVYGSTGNNVKAIEFFEKALKISPDNASILLNLSSALKNAGQVERGNQMYQRAVQLDPTLAK